MDRKSYASVTVTPLCPYSMQETHDKLVPGNPVFDSFDREFEKTGFKILCIFDIGPRLDQFRPRTRDDIKGNNVRATSEATRTCCNR